MLQILRARRQVGVAENQLVPFAARECSYLVPLTMSRSVALSFAVLLAVFEIGAYQFTFTVICVFSLRLFKLYVEIRL